MPEPFLFNTSCDPSKLSSSQRGQIGELAFMRKAASLGLSVAKPCNEGEKYDFIARVDNVCWRVQVKSVFTQARPRSHYRIKTARKNNRGNWSYSPDEIDFLVAYIQPEDLWYVFPASFVAGRKAACVQPGSKKSQFEPYLEAWSLMKPASAKSAAARTAAAKGQSAGT